MTYAKMILSMLLILSLTVFACSKDDDDDNGQLDPGEFPLEGLLNETTSFLIMAVEEWDGEFEAYLSMLILENHQSATLKINGNDINLSGFGSFYFAELDLMPGQSFTYELRVDNNTRSGSLAIPAVVQGNFPANFNLASNYTMNWTTSADPTGFVAFLQIELDDDWIDNGAMLAGSARSHTFNSNIYSGLSEEDIWYIDVGVLAINYDMKDGMVIMAAFDEYEEYYFGNGFGYRQAEKQVAGERPIGRFPGALRHLAVPVE
jgi:hypothetical protein